MEHEVWWATRESKTIYHGHWQTNHTTLLWRQNRFIKDQWIDISISGPKIQYGSGLWFAEWCVCYGFSQCFGQVTYHCDQNVNGTPATNLSWSASWTSTILPVWEDQLMGLKFKTRVPKNPSKSHSNYWFINHHVPHERPCFFGASAASSPEQEDQEEGQKFHLARRKSWWNILRIRQGSGLKGGLGTRTTMAHLGSSWDDVFGYVFDGDGHPFS